MAVRSPTMIKRPLVIPAILVQKTMSFSCQNSHGLSFDVLASRAFSQIFSHTIARILLIASCSSRKFGLKAMLEFELDPCPCMTSFVLLQLGILEIVICSSRMDCTRWYALTLVLLEWCAEHMVWTDAFYFRTFSPLCRAWGWNSTSRYSSS